MRGEGLILARNRVAVRGAKGGAEGVCGSWQQTRGRPESGFSVAGVMCRFILHCSVVIVGSIYINICYLAAAVLRPHVLLLLR